MFPLGRLKVFYISPSLFALTWSNVKAPTESQSQSEFDNGCLIVLEKKADIFLRNIYGPTSYNTSCVTMIVFADTGIGGCLIS